MELNRYLVIGFIIIVIIIITGMSYGLMKMDSRVKELEKENENLQKVVQSRDFTIEKLKPKQQQPEKTDNETDYCNNKIPLEVFDNNTNKQVININNTELVDTNDNNLNYNLDNLNGLAKTYASDYNKLDTKEPVKESLEKSIAIDIDEYNKSDNKITNDIDDEIIVYEVEDVNVDANDVDADDDNNVEEVYEEEKESLETLEKYDKEVLRAKAQELGIGILTKTGKFLSSKVIARKIYENQ